MHLLGKLVDRLAAEMTWRGMTVDELAAETLDAWDRNYPELIFSSVEVSVSSVVRGRASVV
jgi:hypothetical protein